MKDEEEITALVEHLTETAAKVVLERGTRLVNFGEVLAELFDESIALDGLQFEDMAAEQTIEHAGVSAIALSDFLLEEEAYMFAAMHQEESECE